MDVRMDATLTWSLMFAVFVAAFHGYHCEKCELTAVQKCLGDTARLSTSISLHPLDLDLLDSITNNYCGHGFEKCLDHVSGSCSDSELAPYRTITSTLDFVCSTGRKYQSTCLRTSEVQNRLNYCFEVFQADINYVWGDASLTTDDINRGLCGAYESVTTCVTTDVTRMKCNLRDLIFVDNLLGTAIRPTMTALRC